VGEVKLNGRWNGVYGSEEEKEEVELDTVCFMKVLKSSKGGSYCSPDGWHWKREECSSNWLRLA